jgi:hypothetical protein
MDNRIVWAKVPGLQRGFNYIMQCSICCEPFTIKGILFNEGRGIFCSKSCAIKNRHMISDKTPSKQSNYKSGRYKKSGYWMLTIGPKQYIYEHRHIMQEHIGRELDRKEHVHHKNGNRLDNRIDNLELLSMSKHMSEHATKVVVYRSRNELGQFI